MAELSAMIRSGIIGLSLCAILAGCDTKIVAPKESTSVQVVRPSPPAIEYQRPWDDDLQRALDEHVWVHDAIAASRQTGGYAIVIAKREHELRAYRAGKVERSMRVELGEGALLDKERSGDRRTPEGLFRIDRKLDQRTRPKSHYHRFLQIDYPTKRHRVWFAWRKQLKLIPSDALIGSKIGIHGQGKEYDPNTRFGYDWTAGCIAVTNREIEWLYDRAPIGTPVAIVRDLPR